MSESITSVSSGTVRTSLPSDASAQPGELMDAGFNPAAVSGRQGHTVQVMLHHYSTRRQSADKAAADHLGARVHQRSIVEP